MRKNQGKGGWRRRCRRIEKKKPQEKASFFGPTIGGIKENLSESVHVSVEAEGELGRERNFVEAEETHRRQGKSQPGTSRVSFKKRWPLSQKKGVVRI